MAEFLDIITIEEVKRIYEKHFQGITLKTENIPILESLNRILAKDIVSEINLPDFVRSTMDGYALRAEDVFGASFSLPAYLTVIGEVLMGQEPIQNLQKGEAMKIATGGMLPVGADAVIMVEHTEKIDENQIEVKKSIAIGENVVQIGEDIKKGQDLLQKGRKIQSQDIGVMAGIGVTDVDVYQQIRIGIISTGDELISPQISAKIGQVRNINSYLLISKIREIVGIPSFFGIVKDDSRLIKEAVLELIQTNDMVLISGGSSIGTRDLVLDVLKSLGEILVHGVAIKPGKPTIISNVQGKPVFGLPGHPVSSMVVFIILVMPLINKWQQTFCLQEPVSIQKAPLLAIISRNVPSMPGREDYIMVRLEAVQNTGHRTQNTEYKAQSIDEQMTGYKQQSGSQYLAHPIFGKSGLISTMIKADGLVRIPIDSEGLDEGEEVEVYCIF